ncbi:MAG: hypothetical protein B9S34_07300 [Opitutia bacterium Tous-C1TDCM]|nr:MAG: hypothetical protein B9S34_07300 [Opitutae bacterium Tous-C1TDCM]
MKTSTVLPALALVAAAATAAGLAAGVAALPAFGAFTVAMIALLGAHDYAPRQAYTRRIAAETSAETRPLAA